MAAAEEQTAGSEEILSSDSMLGDMAVSSKDLFDSLDYNDTEFVLLNIHDHLDSLIVFVNTLKYYTYSKFDIII